MRHSFPQRLYRRRVLTQGIFSSPRRTVSARAQNGILPMQMCPAMLSASMLLQDLTSKKLYKGTKWAVSDRGPMAFSTF